MKHSIVIALFSLIVNVCNAQTNPAITRWLQNTSVTGRHYVSGNSTPINDAVIASVQMVRYSAGSVYINTNGIPTYVTGPFLDGNPSLATSQNAIFKLPLSPVQNTGTATATSGGNIGIFINGVALFDYRDGVSWKCSTGSLAGGPIGGAGDGVWNRDAIVAERTGFDCSKGHPAMGNYHHHQNPSAFRLDLNVISTVCNLYTSDGLYSIDSTQHSPLLGFAYDGFPIYGAYAYKNLDGTGGIVRMKSSYALRNISTRATYADGTSVTCGPAVSTTYPLGYFREDYQYVSHTDLDYLDSHNGRFCVTPEYPNGIYCYFATVDANWNSAYPYVVGPTYYGVKTGAKVTSITETVTTYPANTAPSIYIAASERNICPGTLVSFTSSTYNGGLSPSFQWKKNGINTGTNSNTYSSSSLANGDVITCVMTTAANGSATSNSIAMTVSAGTTPVITINASPSNVCTSSNISFSSVVTNGGTSPVYDWRRNGVSTGVTTSSYQNNSIVQGDVITCQMTSNASCISTATVISNSITMSCAQPVTLNLNAFIQGYYSGNQIMSAALYNSGMSNNSSACDSITVELHNTNSPYSIVESQKVILNTNGISSLVFSSARASNFYYIALKNRNAIETWSAQPVQFFQNTSYNFTNAQSKAYGNNLAKTTDNLYWALYSGDISSTQGLGNQDHVIESQDYLDMENLVGIIATGYNPGDLTGDGVVESSDYAIMENNVTSLVFAIHP